MKKLSYILLVLTFFSQITLTFALTAPTEPLLSDEQKKQAQESTSGVREATFTTRKALIITASNTAILAINQLEKQITQSKYFTPEQKDELLAIVEDLEKNIKAYQEDVKNAQNADELLKANQELAAYLKENKEEIRAKVATVVMIGIESTLKAAEEYLATAKEVSQALKACGSDTKTLDEYIATGLKQLADLDKLYNEIMADKKVTQDESAKVKQAVRLAAQLSATLATITTEAAVAAETCPAAEAYIDLLKEAGNL